MAISPKQHQARDWMTQLREHLELIREHDEFGWDEQEYRNGQVFRLRAHFNANKVVEVVSRGNAGQAQHVDSLRGGGKRLFLLVGDEAYFFCDEAYPVILPLAANGYVLLFTFVTAANVIVSRFSENRVPIHLIE